jgi:hypothetical protein
MINVSDKLVEKFKTYNLHSKMFSENPALYEITWKYTVAPDRPQIRI